jgi:hypothetical protein
MISNDERNLGEQADACYARWTYERLQLFQPHVKLSGLWASGDWYHVVCPELDQNVLAADGQPLEAWFQDDGKPIGAPVKLTKSTPPDSLLVPERSLGDQIALVGAPLTVRNLLTLLSLTVPSNFPPFEFKTRPPKATLYVPRTLLPYEETVFRKAVAPYLGRMTLEVVVNEQLFKQGLGFRHPAFMQGDIELIPARRLPSGFSADVRSLIEADEDFWMEHRDRLLGSQVVPIGLPIPFSTETSRSLIDASAFPPRNLRTAIALYGQIQIAMPLEVSYSAALEGFRVTESELVSLAEKGRIVFLLPQSIDRYPVSLVQKLAEANSQSMLMSRMLAALTVQERRRRMPILYVPLSPTERYRILRRLTETKDGPHRSLSIALASELGRMWATSAESLAFKGAMGLLTSGIGQIMATIINSLTGRELRLELWSAGSGVDWAAALGSTVIPFDSDKYSEQTAAEMLAAAYSGVEDRLAPSRVGDVEVVIQGLLSIDNDAPILDVTQAFSGDDVNRMRHLVSSMASPQESIGNAIENFNDKIVRYERNRDRLKRLDFLSLVGVFGTILTSATGHPEMAAYIAPGTWLAKYLLQNADVRLDAGGQIAEQLRAANAFTKRDVVMVSRLRNSIKEPRT